MPGTFNGIPLKKIITLKNNWSDFQPLLHIGAVSSRGSRLRLHELLRKIHHFEKNIFLPFYLSCACSLYSSNLRFNLPQLL
jgi:hypothetical protein